MKWPEITQIAGCRMIRARARAESIRSSAYFRNECPQKHAYSSNPFLVVTCLTRWPNIPQRYRTFFLNVVACE